MKTVRDFLRKHALLILSAFVVLSVPAGVTFGKYVQSVTVTDTLNLNVSMKTYTLSEFVWQTLYQSGNTFPAGVNLVLDYSAPAGTERLKNGNTYIDLSDKTADKTTGPIYAYYNKASNTIYVVPETPGRMVAANCKMMFSTYINSSYRNILKSIVINNLDTSQVQSMEDMFSYNHDLESVILGADSGFSTSNVTTMRKMFAECSAVTALDLTYFETSRVTDMTYMFWRCYKLTNIAGLPKFDTSQVTTMSCMFCDCSSMTSLDLFTFNTSHVTDMSGMFCRMSSLQTIKVADIFDVSNVTKSTDMFFNCSSLKGGAGTAYDENYTDKTYAHIDGGTSAPGYFTAAPGTSTRSTFSATGTDAEANGFGLALDAAS